MSTVHTSLCDSTWREFHLNLDFPCMEDIPIHAVSRLEESVFVYPTIHERSIVRKKSILQ